MRRPPVWPVAVFALGACVDVDASDSQSETSLNDNPVPMLQIAGTTFEMGCTDADPFCEPGDGQHAVSLTNDYLMGETEVTQAQFIATMGYNTTYFTGGGPDYPEDSVTWNEAAAYTNALSEAAGLATCYSCSGAGADIVCEAAMNPYTCAGYRLPTEAEWENAARCGTDYLYAGSDDVNEVGWTTDTDTGPHPVATLAPNTCGLYDMTGNVDEWAQDFYAAYPTGAVTDPVGPSPADGRVVRGGDDASGLWCTCTEYVYTRWGMAPDQVYHGAGLRLARTAW